MNPIQSLFARLAASDDSQAADQLKTIVRAWNKATNPDWQQPHFHVRYVACGFAQDPSETGNFSIAALGMQGGRVAPDDALLLSFTADPVQRAQAMQTWLDFIADGILVAYRADSGVQALCKLCDEISGETIEPPVLDLAFLLPELFPDGQKQCRYFVDWTRYFDLPETHDTAMEDAMLVARLWQGVLLQATEQGAPNPSELRRLEKARRWLWAS